MSNKLFRVKSLVVAVLAALLSVGIVWAAGQINLSTMALIGENVEMEIMSPLEISDQSGGITIDWEPGAQNRVFPGQQIAQGAMTLKNVAQVSYAIDFTAMAVTVKGTSQPSFEVTTSWVGKTQGARLVLAPGETIRVEVTVQVAYYSQPASFSGLTLNIWVNPPPTSSGGRG